MKVTALKMRLGSTWCLSWHYLIVISTFLNFSSLNSVSDVDLEAQKRREYEEWFKLQEKEAMEYSACVKYHEKTGESEEVTQCAQQQQQQQQQQQVVTSETKVKTGNG